MKRSSELPVVLILAIATGSLAAAGQSIPTGTPVQVRLTDKLETGVTRQGQTFSGTVAQPLVVGGRTILAQGTRVKGRVADVVSSGRLERPASITLELMEPTSQPLRIDGKSHVVRNTELIGGGTAAGALIGAIAGGKKGAAIGAAVGAGAGTTTAYMTGKKEIVLPAETLLTFVATGGGGRVASSSASPEPSAPTSSGGGRPAGTVTTFSQRDQRVIRRYFQENAENLPPGLAKRGGNLPPGLERHIERDGTLPPGLQKRVQPFPDELERQLPTVPSGCSRVVLGRRALILDAANKILDLMDIE